MSIHCAFCLRPRARWGECEHCGAVRPPTSERTIRCIVAQLRRRPGDLAEKLAADVIEELMERVDVTKTSNEMEVRT